MIGGKWFEWLLGVWIVAALVVVVLAFLGDVPPILATGVLVVNGVLIGVRSWRDRRARLVAEMRAADAARADQVDNG